MHLTLFRETTKAITILQKAQEQTEETYISDDSTNNLVLVDTADKTEHMA